MSPQPVQEPAETTTKITAEAVERAARDAGARELGRSGVVVRDEVVSTQDAVLEQAAGGASAGLIVLAERQTGGRGRRGRAWASPAGGGLWLSILLRPKADFLATVPVALLAGLAVARAIERVAPGLSARLRWPNDVLIGERKVCGILGEAREPEPARPGGSLAAPSASKSGRLTIDKRVVALGIGINANIAPEDLPAELAATATSLAAEAGGPIDRLALLGAALAELEALLARARAREERPALIAAVADRLGTLGRRVRVRFEGGPSIEGEAVRLSVTGGLIVRDASGAERELLAGDLEHLGEAGAA